MDSTWFIQFSDYHVYFRKLGCMIKKTVTNVTGQLLVCPHTNCNCFEETAQITILAEFIIFYENQISHLAFKVTYSNRTATEKNCLR